MQRAGLEHVLLNQFETLRIEDLLIGRGVQINLDFVFCTISHWTVHSIADDETFNTQNDCT